MPYLIKAEQKYPYYYAKTGEFFSSKNSATRIPTLEKAQDYLEEVKLLCPRCKVQIIEFEDEVIKQQGNKLKKQKKLRYKREYYLKCRANETPEQRQKRLEKARQYKQKFLANETPEQRQKRLEKHRLCDFNWRQKKSKQRQKEVNFDFVSNIKTTHLQ